MHCHRNPVTTGTLALGAAVVGVALLATTTSTADPTVDQLQYVIRGAWRRPRIFRGGGKGPVKGFAPLTGFSVTSAPGLTVDQLAQYAQYPNGTISYTTTDALAALGAPVVATPQPNDPLHPALLFPTRYLTLGRKPLVARSLRSLIIYIAALREKTSQ